MPGESEKKPLTIEYTTLKRNPPYVDDTQRLYALYEEAEVYRPAVRGYTESRLKLVFAGGNPEHDPPVRFWFKSLSNMQALYFIMNNALNRRGTTVVDFLTTVSGNEKTKRQLLRDAEAQDLIVLEKIDGKSQIIWPTVKMLNMYEQVVLEHIRTIQDGVPTNINVEQLWGLYEEYKGSVHESREI